MQIEEGWTMPHNEDHQFLQEPLPRNHWVLRRWIDYFEGRGAKFDLVECPEGWQIYRHRLLSIKDKWKKCCADYEGEVKGETENE